MTRDLIRLPSLNFQFSFCSIDFPAKYQSWDATDPMELFEAPTIKNEANPKV